MSILVAVIVFGILVFIHEMGHFLVAKKNGIRVIEFSIGFGPRLFSFDKGETKYSLKLIPFGGACQMLGEDYFGEEEVDGDHENSFESKSVWSRMAVILAGPFFNIVLAFLLALIVMGTKGYDKPTVTYVQPGSPMEAAGIKEGDLIKGFNGVNVTLSREIAVELIAEPLTKASVEIIYERDGKEYTANVTPEYKKTYAAGISYTNDEKEAVISDVTEGGAMEVAGIKSGDIIVAIDGNKISSGAELYEYISAHPFTENESEIVYKRDGKENTVKIKPTLSGEGYYLGFSYNSFRVEVGAADAMKYSFAEVKYQVWTVFKSLGMLFKGQLGANDFTGPVGIVDMIDETYQAAKPDGAFYVFLNIINLMILLSANLGVMNLLPIPGLDGGRFVFLVLEAIFRKPVPKKFEGVVTAACMILIMLFAVYVMYNDITKLF